MSEVAAPEQAPENTPSQVEETSTEATNVEAGNADQKPAEPERPKKSGWEKRIDKLTARAYQAEERAKQLEQRLAEQAQAAPSQPAAADANAPRFDDFETDAEYAAAVAQYTAEKTVQDRLAQDRERVEREQAQHAQVSRQQRIERFLAAGEDANPGFTDAVMAPDLEITSDTLEAALEVPNGAEVLSHLAKTPAELSRIASLSPAMQALEVGRVSERLNNARTTAAPEPVTPVTTAASTPSNELRDDMPIEQWVKMRRKQVGR